MKPTNAQPSTPAALGVEHQMKIYWDGLRHGPPDLPISIEKMRERARSVLPPEAFAYLGGAGKEQTMEANVADFGRWAIRPKMLTNIAVRTLGTSIIGQRSAAPVMMAPIGLHELYWGEGELAAARAAAARGIPFTLSCQSSRTMEEVALAMGGSPRFFQLYWSHDRELARSFIRRAESSGYSALIVTLDTRLLGWRPRDLELGHNPFLQGKGMANYTSDPVFRSALARSPEDDGEAAVRHFLTVFNDLTLTWSDLAWLRENTPMPIVLKGILDPQDARRALSAGVDGIIVSNHGGRQVDGSVSSIEVLPDIAKATKGKIEIGFDSGNRSGADIVKAQALGADYVGLGRPWVYGLAAGGEAGVGWVLDNFIAELDVTLALAGYTAPTQLSKSSLRNRAAGR